GLGGFDDGDEIADFDLIADLHQNVDDLDLVVGGAGADGVDGYGTGRLPRRVPCHIETEHVCRGFEDASVGGEHIELRFKAEGHVAVLPRDAARSDRNACLLHHRCQDFRTEARRPIVLVHDKQTPCTAYAAQHRYFVPRGDGAHVHD